ncbi:MAG: hypothetical protein KDA21_02265, partial [Phycisphaerales bacterium]|nr:hypothetical protein [Phycisphaerales bacterium]
GEWITNQEAARVLVSADDHLPLSVAETRVTRAGKSGRFTTNGENGRSKRILKPEFMIWAAAERKRILDRDDARRTKQRGVHRA